MASTANVSVPNFDVGPCRVTFKSIDLGGTLGNVKISFKITKAEMYADQFGKTLADESVSGVECTVETEIAEIRDKAKLLAVFPNALEVTAGAQTGLLFQNPITSRSSALAGKLVLHPIREDEGASNYDWTFFKAMPSEESEYTFSPTEQGKFKIVWKVLLDTSTTPPRVYYHGDEGIL